MAGSHSTYKATWGQALGSAWGRMLAKVRYVRHVPSTKFCCQIVAIRCQAVVGCE
jgi:hypothetical protein